jgi:hypothetical protein
MKPEQIFDKISELKEKFKTFFQQRKQVSALENHALTRRFSSAEAQTLSTIKFCMRGSFLHEEDADWMARKLDRLQINYLDWAKKTKWVKAQFAQSKVAMRPSIIQTFFDFDKKTPTLNVPVELLNATKAIQKSVRAG